jgi:hypothetical protein
MGDRGVAVKCCLDSNIIAVINYGMRTTVTIDPDTEHLLREEASRTGASFKEVLNGAVRRALSKPPSERIRVEPIFQAPFPAEFDRVSMNRLADMLDDEESIRELSR